MPPLAVKESDGFEYGMNPGGSGTFHFAIVAHRTLPYVVFVGGDIQPLSLTVMGTNNRNGRVYRGNVATSEWRALSGDSSSDGTSAPAFTRHMHHDHGVLYHASDAGVTINSAADVLPLAAGWQSRR
jgi:hypothetical protein